MEIMISTASKFSGLDDGHCTTTDNDSFSSVLSVQNLLDCGLADGVQKSEEHGQRVAVLICD